MFHVAKEIYFLECESMFKCIFLLFKARHDMRISNMKVSKRLESILTITDYLLQEDVLVRLMNVVCYFSSLLDLPISEECIMKRSTSVLFMPVAAKCVYYASLSVQALDEERQKLLSTIHVVSRHLSFDVTLLGHEPSVDTEIDAEIKQLRFVTLSTVVLLQVSLAAMMTQQRVLLGRENVNFSDLEDDLREGNNLTQANSKESLEKIWPVQMIKSFACLVFAVFRYSAIEQDGFIPFSNLAWFLHEASCCRVYTYIRFCLIPFLQTEAFDSVLQLSLMRTLVEDVMVPLSKILAHMGDKKHPHDQMVTPYFLLSREICEDKLGVSDVDALDEVMECYATIGSAYPAFAKYFWMRHSEADGNASKLCQVMDSSLPSEFLFRVVEERIDEPSL